MGPDQDLPTLQQKQDHLGVLRYLRAHEMREPNLVVEHATQLLGGDHLSKSMGDEGARLAALEQLCFAALDLGDHDLSEKCLDKLKEKVPVESVRFRRILARCLEASEDFDGAMKIYDSMLEENGACLVALQRKYCIAKAQKKSPEVVVKALNEYLEQNMADTSAWYEMAELRLSLDDYKGAAYAMEQVVLGCPLESDVHVKLAEIYAKIGGLEHVLMARRHMAQALELDSTNADAQVGLVTVSTQYIEESAKAGKKEVDEHEILVAKELVKYGASEVLKTYKGTERFATMKQKMSEYLDKLE